MKKKLVFDLQRFAAKPKHKQMITPAGIASWAKLKVQEQWKGVDTGKYSITVTYSKEDTNTLLKIFEAEYKKLLKESDVFKGFKPARNTNPTFGEKELPNGDIVFKFTTKAEFKNGKTGEVMKRQVPVFDSKGKKIDVNLGNGSKVKVAIQIVPKMQDSKNYGVSLWFDGIQVLELVEFGAQSEDASSFGFNVEEGFTSEGSVFDGQDEDDQVDEDVEEGQVGDF